MNSIAWALSVRTDEPLYEMPGINKTTIKQEVSNMPDSCSISESCILPDILKASQRVLHKHN